MTEEALRAQSPIGKRIYDSLPNEILLLEEFVTGVGSIVEADRQPHDIDILYRQDTRNQYLERKVGEHIPQDLRPYLHIIYDSRGKHGPGLPFYDLVLKKRAKLEVLPHAYKTQVFKPIPMAKPAELEPVKLEELSQPISQPHTRSLLTP